MEPAQTEDRRRFPLFEVGAFAVAALIVAVVVVAALRSSSTDGATLPTMWAHMGRPQTLPNLLGSPLLTKWQFDAIADLVLVVLAAFYLNGTLLYRRRTGARWPAARTISFVAGLLVCMLATNASIAVYDMALFSAHMVGHLMLVMAGPALLAAGLPLDLLVRASTPSWSRRARRLISTGPGAFLTAAPVALACYAAAIVVTHLTGLMDQIMLHTWTNQLEHLVYVVVGFQFFTVVLGSDVLRWQLTTPARWLLLAVAMAVDTFVGVILLMAAHPISMMPVQGFTVDALSDTHTGGAIMWVGGDGVMALVMILLVRDWITDADRRRRDRGGWLEQARQQIFAENTGGAYSGTETEADADFDDDEKRLAEYNAWLARINSHK